MTYTYFDVGLAQGIEGWDKIIYYAFGKFQINKMFYLTWRRKDQEESGIEYMKQISKTDVTLVGGFAFFYFPQIYNHKYTIS